MTYSFDLFIVLGWGIAWSSADGSGCDFCLIRPDAQVNGTTGPATIAGIVEPYSQNSQRGRVDRVEGKSLSYGRTQSSSTGRIFNNWNATFGTATSTDDWGYALLVHGPVDIPTAGAAGWGATNAHHFENAYPDLLAQHTTTNRHLYYLPMKVLFANGGAIMQANDDAFGRAWVWPNEPPHVRSQLYGPPNPFQGAVVPWNTLARHYRAPQDPNR